MIIEIGIREVLDKLGIPYQIRGSTISLFEKGNITNGWKGNINGNYINDFSGKGRARGGPFTFIKMYLGLSNKETYQWIEKNIGSKKLPP